MRDVNHRNGSEEGQVIELGAAPGFPIVAQIAVHQGPISDIVASPDGSRLMVTNYGRDSVSVIDTDSCRVVQDVPGLNEPFAIAVGSHDADRVYVSTVSPAYDSIEVIDVPTNTVIATHPLALSVSDLAVSRRRNARLRQPKWRRRCRRRRLGHHDRRRRGDRPARRDPAPPRNACASAPTGAACTSAPTGPPADSSS